MAIYWPTPGLKGITFKLCALIRWDFNFCICSSPLRGFIYRQFSWRKDGNGSEAIASGCRVTIIVLDSLRTKVPVRRGLITSPSLESPCRLSLPVNSLFPVSVCRLQSVVNGFIGSSRWRLKSIVNTRGTADNIYNKGTWHDGKCALFCAERSRNEKDFSASWWWL